MGDQREIGVLWRKVSRGGRKYFTGKVTVDGKTVEVAVFVVNGRNARSPDLLIVESNRKELERYGA